jgi:hypothetical protein
LYSFSASLRPSTPDVALIWSTASREAHAIDAVEFKIAGQIKNSRYRHIAAFQRFRPDDGWRGDCQAAEADIQMPSGNSTDARSHFCLYLGGARVLRADGLIVLKLLAQREGQSFVLCWANSA